MNLTNIDDIRELLRRHGFHFSKSMGQNFLTAAWVPEEIAEAAGLDEGAGVLEIGPGIGCLTVELSKRAGRVLAVELDKNLMPVLAETLTGCENTEVLFGDILRKNIAELVEENFRGLRPVVCANLPYNVTSPVLTALLESRVFDTVTVMIQREVAKRICAEPGGKDYSAFSIFCNWYCQTELLFDVPPDCFIPQPKVYSTVIRMKRRECPPARVNNERFFFSIVRAAFNQRRKTLVNALYAGLSGYDKADIQKVVNSCGFNENIRGEVLGIDEFAQIADCLEGLKAADL